MKRFLVALAVSVGFILSALPAMAEKTDEVSIAKKKKDQSNADSFNGTVSSDGVFVSFESRATNLNSKCANGLSNIFVRNRTLKTTTCISINTKRKATNGNNTQPSMAAGGGFVAFASTATDIDTQCANSAGLFRMIFIHSVVKGGRGICISKATSGAAADADSSAPSISTDGVVISFDSIATNLVSANNVPPCDNLRRQIYVREFTGNATTCISRSSNGASDGNPGDGDSFDGAISGNGQFIVFTSVARNLAVECAAGTPLDGITQIYLYDRQAGPNKDALNCISVAGGQQGNSSSAQPSISNNGRYITFTSAATNLDVNCQDSFNHIFYYDRTLGTVTCITPGANADSGFSSVSGDGTWVAFRSLATNVAAPCTTPGIFHIFNLNVAGSSPTICSSVDSNGNEANGDSDAPSTNGNGRYAVFESSASNLVTTDTNGQTDIFIQDRF